MEKRQFRYQQYIDKYKNCPKEYCVAKDVVAFRWVHSEIVNNDFLPNIFHPEFPNRTLDSSDLVCESFALSVYKDLHSAVKKYLEYYNKNKRETGKARFKNQKGTHVALLHLKTEDGVTGNPNSDGHF